MSEIVSVLKRAAERAGLERVRYSEKNTPTQMSNITVLPFFGDIRSCMIMSSLILKRYREEAKGSKYFILVCWPGMESLFPFVDEYWTINTSSVKSMYDKTDGFSNKGTLEIVRSLNQFFEEVLDPSLFSVYYDNGFTEEFTKRFRNFHVNIPTIQSSTILGHEFNRELGKRHGDKVFIWASTQMQGWRGGKSEIFKTPVGFYVELAKKLINHGIVPVIWNNGVSQDITGELGDKCVYINTNNMSYVLSAMRTVGCVLDIFNGSSRLAIMARTPYVYCDSRFRHNATKEYEIDDLCGRFVPREYLYSFPGLLDKSEWNSVIFDGVLAKLDQIFSKFDRDKLPTTSEVDEVVPYAVVRRKAAQKFGVRFIKVPKMVE